MSPSTLARWQKIEAFAFDAPGDVITFEDKLIRETGWTRHFAGRAIAEYRRYLLLAAEAGHPVSPSPAVDEVWHLHLLYTRSYWERLCPDLLGFPLHHEPANGTADDRSKLNDWYARTLESYARIFETPPLAELWPAKPRADAHQRVDAARDVVVSRVMWRALMVIAIVCALSAVVAVSWRASLL
jgi:hypothetical protein